VVRDAPSPRRVVDHRPQSWFRGSPGRDTSSSDEPRCERR
jgi:hypothetical protein